MEKKKEGGKIRKRKKKIHILGMQKLEKDNTPDRIIFDCGTCSESFSSL